MDKNETDYDKLDNELNFDFNIFGLNMLNIDITNTVNIYDFADIESYIEDGSQKVGEHCYGKSITDPCLGWEKSEKLIYELADLW